jgi:hypothetical protein
MRERLFLDWDAASHLLQRISSFRKRGFTRREAAINGLQQSGVRVLERYARSVCLPFESTGEVHLPLEHKSQSGRLTDAAVGSLLRRGFSGFDFADWQNTFSDVHRAHRWQRQQSAQARVQVYFLIGFVPAVSVWLIVSQHSRICENLMTREGKFLLLTAVLLFACGVTAVCLQMRRSRFESSFSNLGSLSGRYNFLTELLCCGDSCGSKLTRFLDVCSRSGRQEIVNYARNLSLGLAPPAQLKVSDLAVEEENYLRDLISVFLFSARGGQKWLCAEHHRAFEDFQADESKKAAVLSLRLLIPMAIFFLPALFLILALSGFSFQSDALN